MRTIETNKTPVEVIAWPKGKRWDGRYATIGSIDNGVCQYLLSNEAFCDPDRANSSYHRFARRMMNEGLYPPNIQFRNMTSKASKNIFCILSSTESVFNSACEVGEMYLIDTGKDENRRICAVLLRDTSEEDASNEIVG